MRRGVAWWTGVLLMIPGIATAGEARLAGSSKLGYDSNVFARGDSREIDSLVWQLSASGAVEDELERGSYKLRYEPTFFLNAASQADNVWNHLAQGEGIWRISPRTSVRVHDEFAYLEKIVFQTDDPDPDPNIDDGNKKTIRNVVGTTFSHAFTRRWNGYLGANYTIYRYSRSQDEDNDATTGFAGVNYALDQRWRVGFGGNATYRTFDAEQNNSLIFCPNGDGPGSRTLAYSGFLSAAYQHDEQTSLQAQAGPARIETTDYVCNGFTFVSQEVNQTTWFAEAELLRRWTRTFDTSLRYRRSEGLGGVGTTTINDTLIARMRYQPTRFWQMKLRAGWIHRSQDAARNPASQVKRTTDSTVWTVAGSTSYRVLQRMRVGVEASWRRQDADEDISNPLNVPITGSNQDVSDYDVYRVFAFITYELEPFRY